MKGKYFPYIPKPKCVNFSPCSKGHGKGCLVAWDFHMFLYDVDSTDLICFVVHRLIIFSDHIAGHEILAGQYPVLCKNILSFIVLIKKDRLVHLQPPLHGSFLYFEALS
jgi:hypothetical protein